MGTAGGLLRFLTCGSVDDGKSTLIGRLLHDAGLIPDDHLAALARDSRRHGTTGDDLDLALLVDGLEAERQGGITIDVAHRYFATPRRSFIVADTPGHAQYTRNMATGASTADLAVVLVDARKGLLAQSRRHACILSLMGVRHVVLAVNKMDLVGFGEAAFRRIADDFARFAATLGFRGIVPIPLSALRGANVVARSDAMPWHAGPTLLEHLETVAVEAEAAARPFRFPVQWVNRPGPEFRGFSGTVASGSVAAGDRVAVAASGREGRVARIVTADGDLPSAAAGAAVTLTLEEEIDVAVGDLLCHPGARPQPADQFAAHVLWMDEAPMLPGRQYMLRIGTLWTPASVTTLRHRLDVDTLAHHAARKLEMNEIGLCHLSLPQPVPFDPFAEDPRTGAFILVDRLTNATAGAGMVLHPLMRAANIRAESFTVDWRSRAARLGHRPLVVWFTGLSGAGKSTIARLAEGALQAAGCLTYALDGDNLRHGLNRDLGFTDADRVENIRRAGEVARLMADAGVVVLCSFISPFRAERDAVRRLLPEGWFLEVFVDAPIEECIRRDPKGLYGRALAGEIRNFTGLDSPYEPPLAPDLHLRTAEIGAEALAAAVADAVRARVLSAAEGG